MKRSESQHQKMKINVLSTQFRGKASNAEIHREKIFFLREQKINLNVLDGKWQDVPRASCCCAYRLCFKSYEGETFTSPFS
jgi:hypothetical protein